jgi:hypothetical protein
MGLPSSWFLLCLYNLFAVEYADRVGKSKGVLVNGDDLLAVADRRWISAYMYAIRSMGGAFSEGKNLITRDVWVFSGVYGVRGRVYPSWSWLSFRRSFTQPSVEDRHVPLWQRAGPVQEGAIREQGEEFSGPFCRASAAVLCGIFSWARQVGLEISLPLYMGGGGLRNHQRRWWKIRLCQMCLYSVASVNADEGDPELWDQLSGLWLAQHVSWASCLDTDISHSYVRLQVGLADPEAVIELDDVRERVMSVGSRDLELMMGPDPDYLRVSAKPTRPTSRRNRYWLLSNKLSGHGARGRPCRCARKVRVLDIESDYLFYKHGYEWSRVTSDLAGPKNWCQLIPGGYDRRWRHLKECASRSHARYVKMLAQSREELTRLARRYGRGPYRHALRVLNQKRQRGYFQLQKRLERVDLLRERASAFRPLLERAILNALRERDG